MVTSTKSLNKDPVVLNTLGFGVEGYGFLFPGLGVGFRGRGFRVWVSGFRG